MADIHVYFNIKAKKNVYNFIIKEIKIEDLTL